MKYLRLLFLSLVLISCKKVEFEKISSSFWNPKLALPIAYGTFTISDILNQADSIDKYIDPDKRPLLQLKLSESINGFTIADAVKIPDFNSLPEQSVYSFSKLSTNDLNTINTTANNNIGIRKDFIEILRFFDPTVQFNQSVDLDFSTGSDLPKDFKINKMKFLNGKIRLNVKKPFPHKIVFKFTFNEITKNSKKLQDSIVYQPGMSYLDINLAGYEADFATKKLSYSVDEMILIPTSGTIVSTDQIVLGVEMTGINFESIEGYFGQLAIPQINDTIKIDELKELKGKFGITNPSIKLTVKNGFGIPVELGMDNFSVIRKDQTKLPLNVNTPLMIKCPAKLGDPDVTSILELNKNTISNIDKLVSSETNEIQIGGKLTVNKNSDPNTTKNFIKNTSTISLDAEVTVPLTGYASGFTFADTSDFSYSFDGLKSLQMRLVYRNTLPIDIDAKVTFLDKFDNPIKIGNQLLNLLSSSTDKLIKSPELKFDVASNSWKLSEADLDKITEQSITIALKESDLPYLKKAVKVVFSGSFETFGGAESKSVTLYDYYGLSFKLLGNVSATMPIKK
jgi:hypothetical protein